MDFMKKALLFGLFLFIAIASNAQIAGKKVSGPYTAKDGTVFKVGDALQFGKGSRNDGSFTYIYQPMNVLTGTPETHFQAGYTGRSLPIKSFKLIKSPAGDITIAIINPGVNFVVDLENAIKSGEILTPASNENK